MFDADGVLLTSVASVTSAPGDWDVCSIANAPSLVRNKATGQEKRRRSGVVVEAVKIGPRSSARGEPMVISPEESRAARRLLRWSQQHVATRLQVSDETVRRFEIRERLPWGLDLTQLRRLYEEAGVEFAEDGPKLKRGR
jgi:DNA-binding transcriptional regulator YiaG